MQCIGICGRINTLHCCTGLPSKVATVPAKLKSKELNLDNRSVTHIQCHLFGWAPALVQYSLTFVVWGRVGMGYMRLGKVYYIMHSNIL